MTDKNTPQHGSSTLRCDIPAAYKWQVNDIYADDTAWQTACDNLREQLPLLQKLKGLLNDQKILAAALELRDQAAQSIEKIYAYARLQQDADNADPRFQALTGEAESLLAAYNNAVSFIEPEILALDKNLLKAMLTEEEPLKKYTFYLENLTRLAEHVLSGPEEELLSKSRLATSSAAASFRALVSADMQFPPGQRRSGQGCPCK